MYEKVLQPGFGACTLRVVSWGRQAPGFVVAPNADGGNVRALAAYLRYGSDDDCGCRLIK